MEPVVGRVYDWEVIISRLAHLARALALPVLAACLAAMVSFRFGGWGIPARTAVIQSIALIVGVAAVYRWQRVWILFAAVSGLGFLNSLLNPGVIITRPYPLCTVSNNCVREGVANSGCEGSHDSFAELTIRTLEPITIRIEWFKITNGRIESRGVNTARRERRHLQQHDDNDSRHFIKLGLCAIPRGTHWDFVGATTTDWGASKWLTETYERQDALPGRRVEHEGTLWARAFRGASPLRFESGGALPGQFITSGPYIAFVVGDRDQKVSRRMSVQEFATANAGEHYLATVAVTTNR